LQLGDASIAVAAALTQGGIHPFKVAAPVTGSCASSSPMNDYGRNMVVTGAESDGSAKAKEPQVTVALSLLK
jgi:hypothetical protein